MLNASISFSFLARHQGSQKKVIWVFQTGWSKPSALAGQLSPKKLTLIVEIFALSYPPGNLDRELPCGVLDWLCACVTFCSIVFWKKANCLFMMENNCCIPRHSTRKNTYNRSAITIETTRAPRLTRLSTIHRGAGNFLFFCLLFNFTLRKSVRLEDSLQGKASSFGLLHWFFRWEISKEFFLRSGNYPER